MLLLLLPFANHCSQVTIESSSDETHPLRGFLECMSTKFARPGSGLDAYSTQKDFGLLSLVANGASSSPEDVHEAVNTIKTQGKGDRSVLASFNALPQGKKLIAQCEEKAETQVHSKKICHEFQKVVSESETLQSALDGCTTEHGMKGVTSLTSSFKAAATASSAVGEEEDEAVKKVRESAKNALLAYAKSLVQHHCKRELEPWLDTQCKTLSGSKLMSQPPGFAILNLQSLLQKTLGETLVGLDDLDRFYKACSELGKITDCVLRTSSTDAVEYREQTVKLCQSLSGFTTASSKLTCSIPDLFKPLEKLSTCANQLVNQACSDVWRESISLPLSFVTAALLPEKELLTPLEGQERDAYFEKAASMMGDAKLLVTGMANTADGVRSALEQAAILLDHVVDHYSLIVKNKVDAATRSMFEMLKKLQLIGENSVMWVKFVIPADRLKTFGS